MPGGPAPAPGVRLAEGWCPHPGHGRLAAAGRWGRCGACGGGWRFDTALAGRQILLFRVTAASGGVEWWYDTLLNPDAAGRTRESVTAAIERITRLGQRRLAAAAPLA